VAAEDELVVVAYAADRIEAGMIQGLLEERGIASALRPIGIDGPQIGIGWLNPGGGSQGVMVVPAQAAVARAVLAEALLEDEDATPEPVNARYLEEAKGGRGPRGYGLVGGYARIYLWSFGLMAAAFGIFLLVRAFS
jgi:Putative prokaryotic signal transducing protein